MIISLEHYGPCLDSSSDEKVPLDIILPEQSCRFWCYCALHCRTTTPKTHPLSYADYPEGLPHPVLRHIHISDVASISTASDAQSMVTADSHPTDFRASSRRKRWRLFNQSLSFKKRPALDPLLSESTMVEKPCRGGGFTSLAFSSTGLRKR